MRGVLAGPARARHGEAEADGDGSTIRDIRRHPHPGSGSRATRLVGGAGERSQRGVRGAGGVARAAALIAAGVGRRRLSRELGVTEYEAAACSTAPAPAAGATGVPAVRFRSSSWSAA